MTDVAVLIPVLSRPERAVPLLKSLAATTPSALPVFLCSPGDDDEIAAANDACLRVPIRGAAVAIMDWYSGPGDYARKINWGAVNIAADWFFLGADDLRFHPGWLEAALNAHEQTGACVVGTNDLGNPRVTSGRHATHSLVHADYRECGTIDEPWKLLHEGYGHCFVDDELIETARARGTFAMALGSIVEHEHPNWAKGENDATYERGQATFHADSAHHRTRQHLWGG